MKDETINELEQRFTKSPFLAGGVVPIDEIHQAEDILGIKFSPDYILFLQRFGSGVVGPYPIFGLRKAESMGNSFSVVAVTKHFRHQNWPGTDKWAVISEDHAGNPIGLSQDGKIWLSDHDFNQIAIIENSFEEYLRNKCLKLF